MRKTIFALIVVLGTTLAVTGCVKEAQQSEFKGAGFKVEKLFEHDGCTVYRFEDYRYVYFTKCQTGTVTTQSSYSCGKSCIADQQVLTESAE